MSDTDEYIVLSAIGADKSGIVNDLSKTVTELTANILDSRMVVMGGEFTIIMMIGGDSLTLDKLEPALQARCEALALQMISRRTQRKQATPDALPYQVNAVALDHPGIVNEITGFYTRHDINVEDLKTQNYAAPLTGSPMFALEMVVNVPSRLNLSELKDQFFDFCDELNLDASIEPLR